MNNTLKLRLLNTGGNLFEICTSLITIAVKVILCNFQFKLLVGYYKRQKNELKIIEYVSMTTPSLNFYSVHHLSIEWRKVYTNSHHLFLKTDNSLHIATN